MYISPRDAESNVEAEPSVEAEIKTRRTGAALALYAIAGISLIVIINAGIAAVGWLGV